MYRFTGIFIPKLCYLHGSVTHLYSPYGPGDLLPNGSRVVKMQQTSRKYLYLCSNGSVWSFGKMELLQVHLENPAVDMSTTRDWMAFRDVWGQWKAYEDVNSGQYSLEHKDEIWLAETKRSLEIMVQNENLSTWNPAIFPRLPFVWSVIQEEKWRSVQVREYCIFATTADKWKIIYGSNRPTLAQKTISRASTEAILTLTHVWSMDHEDQCWATVRAHSSLSQLYEGMGPRGGFIVDNGTGIDRRWPTTFYMVQEEQETWMKCWRIGKDMKENPLAGVPRDVAILLAKWIATPPFNIVIHV